MTFIYGLNPVIKTIVTRFRDTISRRQMTFPSIVQFSRDEGDAERVRSSQNRATLLASKKKDLTMDPAESSSGHVSDKLPRYTLLTLLEKPSPGSPSFYEDSVLLTHVAKPQRMRF